MAIIRTERNFVYAYDAQPDDVTVQVAWHGPADEEGGPLRRFGGPPQPIDKYDEAVAWAVGIADKMEHPLYVVPRSAAQVLTPDRLERAFGAMTDQERGELRRLVVTTAAEVMRDCDDEDLRGEAFRVLAKMGVVDDE